MNGGGAEKWEFFLLRNLAVAYRGHARDPVTGQRKRELLTWLLLHPGLHDRTTVSGQIWPDDSDSVARRKLRQTLKDLIDELGEEFGNVIFASREQVGLPAASVWVDIHSIEEMVEEADAEAVLALAEAELMPEISSEWINTARAKYQVTVVSLLERLANRAEFRDDLEAARRFTLLWVSLSPVAEVPRRELIRRLVKEEEIAEASAAAGELLSLLRNLGLQPSHETRAVLGDLHQAPEVEGEPVGASRESLLVRLGAGDERVALQAAQALAAAAIGRREGTPCLPLTVEVDVESDQPGLQIRTAPNPQLAVHMPLKTVRDLLPDQDRFLVSVLCQLFDLPGSHSDATASLLSRVRDATARRQSMGSTAVPTERVSEAIERLQGDANVAMIGPSAAGKTVAAAQIAQQLTAAGWTVSWIDLSDPAVGSVDLLVSLAMAEEGPAAFHLVVLDDLQANPGVAIQIGNLLTRVSPVVRSQLRVVLLGWDSARQLASEVCPGAVTIPCSGEDSLRPVLEGLAGGEVQDEVLSQVRRLSAGDLLVANEAFQHYLRVGKIPSLQEIAGASFEGLTEGKQLSSGATRLAFHLAALGQFEIDAARTFAEAQSRPALEELVSRRIVRPVGPFVAIGHRSHAALIAMHLQAEHPNLVDSLGSSVRLSLDYLRVAGDGQIVAMLQRLDLASAARRDSDQHGSTFLARAWESIQILRNYLRRQVQSDATWGDNVASAIHAAQTFSRFDEEAWSTTARFVRSRWLIHGAKLPEPGGQASRERDDFIAIAEKMDEEDAAKKAENAPVEMPATSIDFDRVHRTWMLGQLLGFEASAPGPSGPRLEELVAAAESVQEPDGNFYPARIPWVTARVVLGLVAAGNSASSNRAVQQACQWLRRPYPEGPYKAGAWDGGTGTWNSTVETTAMCLSALVRGGVPLDDPAIRAGRAYLLSQRAAWVQPGAEVDAANALEAYILTGGRWREVSVELMHLLSWARDREPWTRTSYLASESQAQSSAVALVANSLVGVLWATVKAELPILLEGIASEREAPAKSQPDSHQWEK